MCVGPAAAACRRQRGFLGPAEPSEGAWRSTGRGVCVGRARVARCVFALGRRDGGQGSWGRLGACGGASRRRRSLARPRARCVPKLAFYCVNFSCTVITRCVSSNVGWLVGSRSLKTSLMGTHTHTRSHPGTRAYRNIRTRLARQEARARCACVSPGMCSVVSTVDAATRATHLDLLVLGLISRALVRIYDLLERGGELGMA